MAETELMPRECPHCGSALIVRKHSSFHPEHHWCYLGHVATWELDEHDYAAWNRRTPPSTAGWLPMESALKLRAGLEHIRDHNRNWAGAAWAYNSAGHKALELLELLAPSQEGASEGEG